MSGASPNREQILDLVGLGMSRAEIAEELNMSSNAVKKTLRSACRQHGVNMQGLRRRMARRPGTLAIREEEA